MPTIRLDDGEYDYEALTDASKKMIAELQKIEERIKEKNNMVAILTKAKRAYIADLK